MAYREKNKERVKEYQRKYKAVNRLRIAKNSQLYRVANKDKIAKTGKEVSRREREDIAADAVTHGKFTKAMAATGATPNCANAPRHRMECKSSTPDARAEKYRGNRRLLLTAGQWRRL